MPTAVQITGNISPGEAFAIPEKQKPQPKIVQRAAILIKNPEKATKTDVQKMAARILDDQKNDPQPHQAATKRTAPAKKPAPATKPAKRKK